MGSLPFTKIMTSTGLINSTAGNLHLSGYAVYSYIRDKNGRAGSFTFNGVGSANATNGFGEPLGGQWLFVPDLIMTDWELEDTELIRQNKQVEYTIGFNFQGTDFKFLTSKFPFTTAAGTLGLIVTVRDVTFYLDSVDETGFRQNLFSLIADNMTDVFCVFDMDARPTFLSPSVEKLTGYTASELSGITLSELLKPNSVDELKRIWEVYSGLARKTDTTGNEISPVHFELEFIRKDRESRWAEVSSKVFFDKNGKITGVHGIVRDITGRKAEQESMHNTLQHEIELSMVKSKYISTISHEFRTPLSIIYSNLQLLENHRFQLDEETIGDAFELSRMAVKSLLRVLDKVTVIDAVNKNKMEFRPASVDLAALCIRIVKDLNEMEMYPDRIDLVIEPILQDIWIDESLFGHIFTNLLHNALSFSDKKLRVQFGVSLIDPGNALFVISDSGIGIPEEEQQYVFEPFYRASNSRNARGSGLGLAVVRECVRLHKGSVSFESKVGAGSVFKVILPVMPEV